MTLRAENPGQTVALGERIGALLKPGAVLALRGGLAAGKTTLVKGIAKGLGIADDIVSPTYTLIREYSGRLRLFHMDAYRLGGSDEFLSIGVEEYLYGDGVSVIEWSERVEEMLPENAVRISLEALPDGVRRIEVEGKDLEEALL